MTAPGRNKTEPDDITVETSAGAAKVQPASPQELANIEQLADMALDTFKSQRPDSGYDAHSIKRMSDTLDLQRSILLEDQSNIPTVANMFGAFLGKAIIEWSEGYPSRWIRSGNEIGVEVVYGKRTARFFPISRVFRQIEYGSAQSAWDLFQAMQALLQEAQKCAATAKPAPAAPRETAPPRTEKIPGWKVADSAKTRNEVESKAANVQPVSAQDLAQLEQLADRTLQFYRKHVADFGYDAHSVKMMSKHLDKQRAKLQAEEAKVRAIANMYGAYLGKAIILSNPQSLSRWIRSGEELGVEIVHGSLTCHAFPVSRIVKQIESGEQTAWELFESMQAMVRAPAG